MQVTVIFLVDVDKCLPDKDGWPQLWSQQQAWKQAKKDHEDELVRPGHDYVTLCYAVLCCVVLCCVVLCCVVLCCVMTMALLVESWLCSGTLSCVLMVACKGATQCMQVLSCPECAHAVYVGIAMSLATCNLIAMSRT